MSADGNADGDGERPAREIAYRLFATEFDDADFSYSESDEERAPNYVVTPSGARVNRLFTVGVLTEIERINDNTLRGRVVDPTGAFVTYAGQYQPDAMAFLDRTSPPAFAALAGKARTFQPEDSDRVFTSVRPESLSRVDAKTRDRWTVTTAEATLRRVGVMAAAIESGLDGARLRDALLDAGVDYSLAAGVPLALDHYGTTTDYLDALRRVAVEALELVADERDAVSALDVAPDESTGSGADAAELARALSDVHLDAAPAETTSEATAAATAAGGAATSETETEAETESVGDADGSEPTTATTTATPQDASADAAEPATSEASTAQPEASTADTDSTESSSDVGSDLASEAASDTPSASTDTSSASADETPEPTTGDTPATDDTATDELGDFDDATTSAAASDAATDALDDFDDGDDSTASEGVNDGDAEAPEDVGMYELDDDERERIESEYGAEFETGTEVDPAGEADIDVPSADELAEEESPAEETPSTSTADTAAADADAPTDVDEDDTAAAESTADDVDLDDIDLEDAAVAAMADLDDGDGASREAVVARVVDEYGADPGAVEDAIQSALMSGQCYEPSEDSLKAI